MTTKQRVQNTAATVGLLHTIQMNVAQEIRPLPQKNLQKNAATVTFQDTSGENAVNASTMNASNKI